MGFGHLQVFFFFFFFFFLVGGGGGGVEGGGHFQNLLFFFLGVFQNSRYCFFGGGGGWGGGGGRTFCFYHIVESNLSCEKMLIKFIFELKILKCSKIMLINKFINNLPSIYLSFSI